MIRKIIEYQCDLCKENFKEGEIRCVKIAVNMELLEGGRSIAIMGADICNKCYTEYLNNLNVKVKQPQVTM